MAVGMTKTIKAIAIKSGMTTSDMGSATYTIGIPKAATPTFSPVQGTYSSAIMVAISSATAGATIRYTLDNSTPTASSTVYTASMAVGMTKTIKAITIKSGFTTSDVGTAIYTIGPAKAATPTFSPVAGTYASPISVTISSATAGATIRYTTDNSTPTATSAVYSAPMAVGVSKTIKAIAIKSGLTNSDVGTAPYVITNPYAATPTFSPAAGTYPSAIMVTISSGTAGATIRYTLDGSNPTATSAVYSGPMAVGMTKTIKAIAIKTGYTTSSPGTAQYVIGGD